MNIQSLRIINNTFLDNLDCISLNGEFAGMKTEWQSYDEEWYRNQANEIVDCFVRCCHPNDTQFCGLGGRRYYKARAFVTIPSGEDRDQQIRHRTASAEFYEAEISKILEYAIEPALIVIIQQLNGIVGGDIDAV